MKIGILGGGQLARMLIEESNKFAFDFLVFSNEPDSPAGKISRNEFVGDWNDDGSLLRFAESCDLITLENEFIDYKRIELIESTGKSIYPGSNTIKLIQDKLVQKQTLQSSRIPLARFTSAATIDDVRGFANANGYPVILKSRTMGYDGKGNVEIKDETEIESAFEHLSERGKLMCESFVKFDKEIATQVVRNKSGEVKVYPVVETVQKNHICNLVIASAGAFKSIENKVSSIATRIVTGLDYVGVMGIEMFLVGEEILVNELAPRVHNSGHYTIEGCYTSQFENHIRAVMNLPPGSTGMIGDHSVMINILGERDGVSRLKRAGEVLQLDKTYLHLYGKKFTKPGRKMGHITVLGKNREDAIKKAQLARECIDI